MSTSEVVVTMAMVMVLVLVLVIAGAAVWVVKRIIAAVRERYSDGYAAGYVDGVLANPPRKPGGEVVPLRVVAGSKPGNNDS